MRLPQSFDWVLRVALRIFILLAVAFLSMLTAIRLTIHSGEVTVPDVTKLRAGDAQARLAALDLAIKIEDRVFSELPADAVVRQSPRAGESVRKTQRVHVVLSLGAQTVAVPNVTGAALRSARIAILQAGLQPGHVSALHLPGTVPEVVVDQDPPAAGGATHSPRVNLLVSEGPAENAYVMPDLTGLTLGEAQRRLEACGLVMEKVAFTPGPEERRGAIVGQSQPRGSRVVPGTHVDLQLGS